MLRSVQRARPRRRVLALSVVVLSVLALAVPASAHSERDVFQPEDGPFPSYRDAGPTVVVCKPDSAERIATLSAPLRARNQALLEDCAFEDIQPAVNWVAQNGAPGYRILVLPGVYREEPSRRMREQFHGAPIGREDLADTCAEIGGVEPDSDTPGGAGSLTYEQQATCPHLQNLIAIHGDTTPGDDNERCDGNLCDLQLEGTGGRPQDVIVDGALDGFLNGIKADRADGVYLKNLTAQRFEFNGVYVIETAGATIDDVVGSFNHEYGFLSFVSFVRYENCGGQANGDSVVYPGASPNILDGQGLIPLHRDEMSFATEVRGCRGHHSALGFSGTTGNSIWTHHNEFDHNATGWASDSLFPGHPGTPQNHALVENNLFHENNVNHYSWTAKKGVCDDPLPERDYEDGAVCPSVPLPVGTGDILAGGNLNWFHGNRYYDNWRQGTYQFWVPAEIREGGPDPDAHFRVACGPDGDQTCPFEETSHWNTYSANRMAEQVPFGSVQPNGADFSWDLEGQGNCWDASGEDANTSAAGDVTYRAIENPDAPDLPTFPDCEPDQRNVTYSAASSVPFEAGCIEYDATTNPEPAGCDWFEVPAEPAGRQPEVATLERLDGTDRIETAILASHEGFPTQAPTVVLARADLYPDALAGAPLAHARGGPLLLTPREQLDPRVIAELQRLRPTTVVLLGGWDALSPVVEAQLRGLGLGADDIVRLAGADRFATAALIADSLNATDAFVAKGDDVGGPGWVDAMAVSSTAALLERPILLTRGTSLPAATREVLEGGSIRAVDVVGGPVAVADEVFTALEGLVTDVERVSGEDRYATSLAIARFALKAGADPTELWLTTGTNWPDGLAAGSAIAVDEGLLMLVDDAIEGSAVATWLEGQHPFSADPEAGTTVADVLERVRVLGGPVALPTTIDDELADRYGATAGDAQGDRSTGVPTWVGRVAGRVGGVHVSDVHGVAWAQRTLIGSTRARLDLAGLEPGAAYSSHLHVAACDDGAGAHLAFPSGGDLTLAFHADGAGYASVDETVFEVADDAPASVVVHDEGGTKIACADLR